MLTLSCSYREEGLSTVDLRYWEHDRIKETARGIVSRRRDPGRILTFSSINFRELRDAVDRAAEEMATCTEGRRGTVFRREGPDQFFRSSSENVNITIRSAFIRWIAH